jgi:hypothetical protein
LPGAVRWISLIWTSFMGRLRFDGMATAAA